MKKTKRLFSLLLALAVLTSMCLTMVQAAELTEGRTLITAFDYTITNKDGTIAERGTIDFSKRYTTGGVTLSAGQSWNIQSASGLYGFYITQGYKVNFSYLLNKAVHTNVFIENSSTHIKDLDLFTVSAQSTFFAPTTDYYYFTLRNLSSETIVVKSASIDYGY